MLTLNSERAGWAMQLGFASYARMYRACMLVHLMSPKALEAAILADFEPDAPKRPTHKVQKFDEVEYERVFGSENIIKADFTKFVGAS